MIVGMAPTVVFLHGFTHTGRSWHPVIAALGERYTSVADDIRGHGDASERVPVSLEAVIGDVEAAIGPERYTLVGYSMGGRIALHVALAAGDRVERLVLIGASPGIADATLRDERRRADEQLADEIERSSIEEFARRWARTPVLAGLPPSALAAHADRLRSTPAGLARALRGLGTGALPSLWDRLGDLAMPVILAVGERDEKFLGIAAEMSRGIPGSRIPGAQVLVVPGAGHAVHLEAPEAIARALPLR